MNASIKLPSKKLATPAEIFSRIQPGTTIFLGSGVAEPRTLIDYLVDSGISDTNDLDVVQLTSHSDILSVKKHDCRNLGLKTFISTSVATDSAITDGVDFIPARISQIPRIIKSKLIPIDVAMLQITPPNEAGYCSIGVGVDVAREAMQAASLVVGEINHQTPFTFGDTFVSISDFDFVVESRKPMIFFQRPIVSNVMDQVAANIAQMIEDGDCLSFFHGPLFEALGPHLKHKRHLGIHSSYFTDVLMDLVKSGAVTNYYKKIFRGKSVTSYALGTPELMKWLDNNPLVEFQGIENVFDPTKIGANPNVVIVDLAQTVDLQGKIAFPAGKGDIIAGPGQVTDLITGAEISNGGRTLMGLPSRNANGDPNIVLLLPNLRNQFQLRESIDAVVTEYGIANLKWRTIRERAQALIDIAHPDDRETLVRQAKERKILFADQIFLAGSAALYPSDIGTERIFKDGIRLRFRAIKPSDEEEMRRLFYRFSDQTVYRRFFYPIKTMPHHEMQQYVNIDYSQVMSIVALHNIRGEGHIIAEARYAKDESGNYGDVAFLVYEKYQGSGIGTYLYEMLVRLAKERGLKGFTAHVLQTNKGMLKVFEKGEMPISSQLKDGVYKVNIPFYPEH